jgi:N-acyl-D-aspartate/D-glutamate deacylase
LAVETGVPVTFGVLPSRDWQSLLGLIDEVAAQGGRMFAQSHSRGVANVLSFRSRLPFDTIPDWKPFRALSFERQLAGLKDPAVRGALVEAAQRGDYGQVVGAEPRRADYEAMMILSKPIPPYRSVAEAAAERNIDPVEHIIDLAIETNLSQMFVQPLGAAGRDALFGIMKHPRAVMTFSDAGAHVSQIMDSSIQTHLLAYWVRQEQAFTLEEAVRMITLAPATAWGFSDRGLLREGMVADINVFDPDRIAPALPSVVSDLPGGATRLMQNAVGILATILAGDVTFRDGIHTGEMPGRLLRGPLAQVR